MNGGYNPRNHLNVCKKVLTEGVHRRDITIDVHGNSLARVDYIEDYMTKIANEQGDFSPIPEEPDVSYKEFQKQVEDIYKEEGYNNWLETKLIEKYIHTLLQVAARPLQAGRQLFPLQRTAHTDAAYRSTS